MLCSAGTGTTSRTSLQVLSDWVGLDLVPSASCCPGTVRVRID